MSFLNRLLSKLRFSRYFYKSFLSSIIILFVVLLILGSVVYISFINTLQSEIENANISQMGQIVDSMDMRFKEIDRIAVSINSNNELNYYSSISEKNSSYKIVKELEKYKSSNGFLYDISYFFNYENQNNDKIFSSLGEMSIDLFFKYAYHYENWNKEDFFNQIKKMDKKYIRTIEPVKMYNQLETNLITSIYPLPINTTSPTRVILFMIDQNVLNGMIKNVLRNYDGYIYFLDENNRLIYSYSEGKSSSNALDLFRKLETQPIGQKVNNVKIDDINYSVVNLTSDYNGWKYIEVLRTNQFMSKAYARKYLFNVSLAAVIIIGIIIAFGLAFQNYKPMHKLIEKLSGKTNDNHDKKRMDELEYISNAIDQIRDRNKYLRKGYFLMNLFQGKYTSDDEINAAISETLLHLGMKHFKVCIFFIDDQQPFTNANIELQNTINLDMVEIIEGISNKIENFNCYGVKINDDRSIALLLNFDDSIDIKDNILELLLSIKDYFKEYYSFTIGVGSIYSGMENIKNSYEEAKIAVYYRLLMGKDHIIFYENIRENPKKKYKYPLELETALLKAIKQPDMVEVKQIINEIKEYIYKQQISLESIQCICFGIINSVIKIIDDMQMDASDYFVGEEDYLSLQTFDTLDSMIDRLTQFCSKICEYKIEQKENKNLLIKDKIFSIIDNRLNDSMLTLEGLAVECGISPSYLSRYFKQLTGYSPMQYVDMQRMHEAKELLLTTNFSLEDILNKVGYVDKNNFIRKFKKLEGISPIKFRNLNSIK